MRLSLIALGLALALLGSTTSFAGDCGTGNSLGVLTCQLVDTSKEGKDRIFGTIRAVESQKVIHDLNASTEVQVLGTPTYFSIAIVDKASQKEIIGANANLRNSCARLDRGLLDTVLHWEHYGILCTASEENQ